MNDISIELENGLYVCLDWLSFTILKPMTVEQVTQFLGIPLTSFTSAPKGRNGYKSMLKLSGEDICILYDGNDNMGIHVDVSGSSIYSLMEYFEKTLFIDTPFNDKGLDIDWNTTLMMTFLEKVREIGQFSRIDVAIDDFGCNFYSLDMLQQVVEERRYVSKFRKHDSYIGYVSSTDKDIKTGHTIYFGNRKSDIFLRVYDKKLEQQNKFPSNEQLKLIPGWVRWEFELKGDRCKELSLILSTTPDFSTFVLGLLNNYFRIVKRDDSNITRCPSEELWTSFIMGVEKARLYIPRPQQLLSMKRKWFFKYCAPTMSAIVLADGGDFTFFSKAVHNNITRINSSLRDMVIKENPDSEEIFRRYCDVVE